jgi:N-acetylglucosaminyldiphosphoundecaprenol N-acetyl-beta-D-mannosaminyltransferase
MVAEAANDDKFAAVVSNADLVTPDGIPVSWALRILYGFRQPRVAGMDLLPDLLAGASATGLPVYFYGGTNEMLSRTSDYIDRNYPQLVVAGMCSPPFRPLTETENNDIISQINISGAKIVFVVLGCPKQEKWMAAMRGRVNAVMIGIGGALPVMVGLQKRAPQWMQQSGFEWLYRLIQEPRRLFKRYFTTNLQFIFLLFTEWFKLRILRRAV